MAFLRKSLSEDSVDRYSHTWAFLFMLLLSLITLLIPLSPSLDLRDFASSKQMNTKGENGGHPTFKSACWVPQEFTLAMTYYAQELCSSAYNAIAQGRNFSGASLIIRTDDPFPIRHSREELLERQIFASKKSRKSHEKQEKHTHRAKHLFSFATPLYLFLLALFLRLPHAIWSLLSSCCGCINVDRTLAAAQTAHSLDSDGQEKVYEEMALILPRLGKKRTGLLYLFMKLMMVVVACLGIFTATQDFLQVTEEIENKLKIEKSNEDTGMAFLSRQSYNQANLSVETLQDFPEALFCNFEIAQLQNVQSWVVQCLFTPEDSARANGREAGAMASQARGDHYMSEEQILLMYKALYTGVWSVFIILLILNVGSFLVWCLTLFLPSYRSQMGLNSEATVDLTFLIAMARQNTSCLVVTELVKRSSQHRGDRKQ